MDKILFVCTGNTCRSPMAQAIYEHMAKEAARSAGMGAHAGDPLTENAARALETLGITGFTHHAAPLTPEMVSEADTIYFMTDMHKRVLCAACPEAADKVFLLEPDGRDISDPFGKDLDAYLLCAREIENSIRYRVDKRGEQNGD